MSSMRCCLQRLNLDKFKAASKSFFSPINIVSRLCWANTHDKWTLAHRANISFTDESPFIVKPTKISALVWLVSTDRLNPQWIVTTFKSVYLSIKVWTDFSVRGRTP